MTQLRAEVTRAVAELWTGNAPWHELEPLLAPPLQRGRTVEECVLVAASLLGHAPGLARFDAALRSEAAHVARQRKVDQTELAQSLRSRLLGPGPEGGRLARWDGQGALAAWLRVVATRLASNLRRAAGVPAPSLPPQAADSAPGPERALLQRQYGDLLKEALAGAASGLEARDRTVLRLHLLQGVSLTRLATMYRRDVSTLSRWVDRARTSFAAATREALKARLRVSEPEFESFLRAVDLEVSVNLSGYFRSSDGG